MKVYDLNEACELLKVSKQTIRKYIRTGALKASKIGRNYIVSEENIKEFLNSKLVKTTQ